VRYVLDVSAALCWVLPREGSSKAIQLREEFSRGVHALIAPSIFAAEAASALTKAERQKLIAIGHARFLLADILNTAPTMHPFEPMLSRAVDISSQFRSGCYDCLYIALAERENCQFVTDDQKVVANLRPHFPFILPVASLPFG